MKFWNVETEKEFFEKSLKSFATPDKLFYNIDGKFYAYVPKSIKSKGDTLQSRNSLIGHFTETFVQDFFAPIAESLGLFAVNGVVCNELSLSKSSNADLAFCTTNEKIQKPENVKAIFEVKMSIVNNYEYHINSKNINLVGNYTEHNGTPSILRSDSMLKAIGKSVNIRVSGGNSDKIPIFIIGNSPITKSYKSKVDHLKKSGVIQGFISIYEQMGTFAHIKDTVYKGFQTFNDFELLKNYISDYVKADISYFSSMITTKELGKIVRIASKEKNLEEVGNKFLELIR